MNNSVMVDDTHIFTFVIKGNECLMLFGKEIGSSIINNYCTCVINITEVAAMSLG